MKRNKMFLKQEYIEQRTIESAMYIIENNATVREVAEYMGVPKSTIHHSLKTKLKDLDYSLYEKVDKLLKINKEERHIRGGNMTREKYERLPKEERYETYRNSK